MRWTQQQYNEYIAKRLPVVDSMGGEIGKQNSAAALVRYKPRQPKRKGCLAVIITIIAFRHRLCDTDNSGMGTVKSLRDAIADSIECDDGSERIQWQYGQVHTSGEEGTLIAIERVQQ